MLRVQSRLLANMAIPRLAARQIALLRLILAAVGLVAILLDPAEPDHLAELTYSSLCLYALYCAVFYVLALRDDLLPPMLLRLAHWLDVGWYTVLISLSSGTNSIFFFGFYFAILEAAFQWGLRAGMVVTVASVLIYSLVGLLIQPEGEVVELNRFLLRPTWLLVLGYMISFWGGNEVLLKRRLGLLGELPGLSNPRFGVPHMIYALVERLRLFYEASSCLVVLGDSDGNGYRIYRAGSAHADAGEALPAEAARLLLDPAPQEAVVYGHDALPWRRQARVQCFDSSSGLRLAESADAAAAAAALLDVSSFASVPFVLSPDQSGRLYLGGAHFDLADAHFLVTVVEHITPALQNIRLVDRLASAVADEERLRIARDLHDSVIQPYIGLQIGLEAVRRKQSAGLDVSADLQRLANLTEDGLADLRGYVRGLKGAGKSASPLLQSVRRFTVKYADVTGIAVRLDAPEDLHVNDRLAAEVFQIVAEGLSNVRRHTNAEWATVALNQRDRKLVVRVENNGGDAARRFEPRSISERVAALGGRVRIDYPQGTSTAVVVEIPL